MVRKTKRVLRRHFRRQKKIIALRWKRWRFKNTGLLLLSLVAFFYLAQTPFVKDFISQIGSLGYAGAFMTGVFFVSVFTVAPATVVLFHLADTLHPLEVALLAGLGAMVGDYIIFRFMKDRVFDELLPLVRKLHTRRTKLLFKSPYFAWFVPVMGALIIMSPLPDEAGVSILGLSRLKKGALLSMLFILNATGIFIVVALARL